MINQVFGKLWKVWILLIVKIALMKLKAITNGLAQSNAVYGQSYLIELTLHLNELPTTDKEYQIIHWFLLGKQNHRWG